LRTAGLPPLFIPSADSFITVDLIPLLPTGKVDLGAVRTIALERFTREPISAGG
jgi:acyl-[acyl-carrier-protein]-phospholipid O-acyltransferase/long-chain-fatty-acid--[acyl-carrier-protein] ligase